MFLIKITVTVVNDPLFVIHQSLVFAPLAIWLQHVTTVLQGDALVRS